VLRHNEYYHSDTNVEDLKHFLLDCPAYDDLRAVCPAFPADMYNTLASPGCVAVVMGHSGLADLSLQRSVLAGVLG
jgi:hypothetical protein